MRRHVSNDDARRRAGATAAILECTDNLAKAFLKCHLAAAASITRDLTISAFERPCATSDGAFRSVSVGATNADCQSASHRDPPNTVFISALSYQSASGPLAEL